MRTLTALAMMEVTPLQVEEALRKTITIGERGLGTLKTEGLGHLWDFQQACAVRLIMTDEWEDEPVPSLY